MNQNTHQSVSSSSVIIEKLDGDFLEAKSLSPKEILKGVYVDPKEEILPPRIAWETVDINNNSHAILGTLGNFSVIIGHAKARKTFFTTLSLSAVLSKHTIVETYRGNLPSNKSKVLYFDTEQGKHHVQLSVRRILNKIGEEDAANLSTYHLRKFQPQKRLELIEYAIENTENLGFVVIDGIKDLVTSINDEEQASMIASKLLKWTEEREIHIITVLHKNKTNDHARGHLGTELINKAETVLSVSKSEGDSSISIVEASQTRNKEPEVFAFEIDGDSPVKAINADLRTQTKKDKIDILDLEDYRLYQILMNAFGSNKELSYSRLTSDIKQASKEQIKNGIGNNKAKDVISYSLKKEWLYQDGNRKPYVLLDYGLENNQDKGFSNDNH